ncbi:uncharacterized protein SCODWIG_04011 [Saccharomycodes ludwigii]|uniref:UvrD-like helicase C-terminal domain-containing protein n=1 Tax=Saccharomycodes ludwigii TaxID=36035 RepID=A0A376BC38_9ASCO|nr:uncharacterized protein SCODWIG_04011 [Saccharomycodes ludwigii]
MIGPKTIQLLYHNSQLSGLSMWDFILAKKYPIGVNKPALLSYLNNMKDEIPNWYKITDADELFTRVCVLGYKFGISNGVTTAIDSIEEFEKNITQFYKTLKLCELNKPPEESLLSWFLEKYLEESCIYAKHLKDESMKDIGHLQISTVHASKGLEFPIVFVLDKWRLATNRGYGNDTAPGEYRSGLEPNVKYVAITRARNLLYIINSHDGSIPPPNYNETWNRKTHNNIYNNHSFWEYYCMDLNRPFPGNRVKGSLLEKKSCDTFEELAKKYQFLRRSYHTINCSRVSNRLCRIFLKNIIKR